MFLGFEKSKCFKSGTNLHKSQTSSQKRQRQKLNLKNVLYSDLSKQRNMYLRDGRNVQQDSVRFSTERDQLLTEQNNTFVSAL